MKNKIYTILRKTIVLLCSLFIVGVIVTIFFRQQNRSVIENEVVISESLEEENAVVCDGGSEKAKAAMSQDEMEKEIAKFKQPINQEKVKETDETSKDTSEQKESTIDFDGLQKINPNVYAWISIPGTKIDYPILQHPTDNSYYLNYNIDGSFGYPGCIYTEKENAKDFSDPNTVIYGHNMKNGTMFAELHKYEDREFFDQNKDIIIHTSDNKLNYKVFAAYIYDDRHLLYSFDFHNKDIFQRYLDDIYVRRDMTSNIDSDSKVTSDDKIITLVTCMGKQPDKRLLVQAVLQK